jgi:outer membrane lipoprotein carrier protein
MIKRCKKGAGRAALVLFALVLLSFSFHIFTVSAYGPTTTKTLAAQSEADKLVRQIETRYGRMRGLAADFSQVYSNGAGAFARREQGRLFLARPRLMRWEYDPKPGKLFIVNGRDIWLYVPSDREATRADAASVADARFPFLFLLGGSNLRRLFRSISLVENNSAPSDLPRTLRLIPRGRVSGLREIFLEVYADGRISKLRIIDEAGASSEISLTNVRENFIAPAEAFEFRPPPGVTVRRLD